MAIAAIIPTKKKDDAGFDVYGIIDEKENLILIKPFETAIINTGLCYEISEGWHLICKERGSTGKIGLKVSAGVNDNSYRGEIKVFLYNSNLNSV